MERALSSIVVVADAQPRRSGFGDDPPAQRLDLGRLALARRVALPPSGAGNLLKRPADKLDGAFHSGAILLRPAQPRQFHQRRQLVQAGAQGAWILCHYPPTGTAGEGFGIRRRRNVTENQISRVLEAVFTILWPPSLQPGRCMRPGAVTG